MICLICKSPELKRLQRPPIFRLYYFCTNCDFIFLNPDLRLSAKREKERYLTHQNNITDPSYQKFVRPLVEIVLREFPQNSLGLDFGSGSGPVLTHLLKENNYQMETYDPYFSPDWVMSKDKYRFIVTCEVVEHLYDPLQTFKNLQSWLMPGGFLIAKTHLWEEQDLFDWYYSRDPTHVSFYSRNNLNELKKACGFSKLSIQDSRVFWFKK